MFPRVKLLRAEPPAGSSAPMNTAVSAPARPKRSAWEIQRAVLQALLLREMKARVGGQWVGAVWTLLEPLAHVAVIVTVWV